MSEPLRDKQCWYLDGVPIHHSADVKSAVEYRKTWKPIIYSGNVAECDNCEEKVSVYWTHPDYELAIWGMCQECVEERCYPDLFPEKEEVRE